MTDDTLIARAARAAAAGDLAAARATLENALRIARENQVFADETHALDLLEEIAVMEKTA